MSWIKHFGGILLLIFLGIVSCSRSNGDMDSAASESLIPESELNATATATFAGGCFWCIEAPFEKVPGVAEAVSGYAGGEEVDPTYEQVAGGRTGHTETVQVHYDPDIVTYEQLLDFYWRQFDPTDAGGSFVDRGSQYRSAIFYHNEQQRRIAEESKRQLQESDRFNEPIVTPIQPLDTFYVAEEYHQDYYKKEPRSYNSYRRGSGRDQFLNRVWGDERTPQWLTAMRDSLMAADTTGVKSEM